MPANLGNLAVATGLETVVHPENGILLGTKKKLVRKP